VPFYDAATWANFFVATAGAAAAVTGLLFIALSINLQKIIAYPSLPQRAAETVAVFASVLFIALAGLVPQQGSFAFGVEVLAIAVPVWACSTVTQSRALRGVDKSLSRWKKVRVMTLQLAMLPFVAGGVSSCLHAGGGIAWVAMGTVLAVAAGIFNTWVLMVEIVR